jgi:hypothetical protein
VKDRLVEIEFHKTRVSSDSAPFCPHILALLKNSTEAGNLLRGNDALHAMLGARTRVRMQSVLVTMMFISLIARLLN